MQRIYLETTIVSYLTARPSRDLIVAGHQQITHDWWNAHSHPWEPYISQLVVQEASDGDPQAAQLRLQFLSSLPLLEIKQEAIVLAAELIRAGALPKSAEADALHVAIAAIHRIPFMLTWNCRHLANAMLRDEIESTCASNGFPAPIICTPEELMGTSP